MRYLAKLLVKK